jgi:hypothetical protein
LRVGVVAREPEGFAVVRVVGATASIVVLLLTLVQDWDAISDHSVSDHIAGSRNIVVLGREARVVVVLAERSQQRNIVARALCLGNLLSEIRHAAGSALESID